MASLGPAAVSVTWGAGGSTSDRSLGLAKFVAEEVRGGRKAKDVVECILHLTCTNMERSMVVAALDVSVQVLGSRFGGLEEGKGRERGRREGGRPS